MHQLVASHRSPEVFRLRGYIKAENKEQLAGRLDRIEGQVRGIKRMVDREAYCIDILTQITSLVAASEKVATILIKDHLDRCVTEALEKGENLDERTEEIKAAIERFLRV
jgi:DNA-binding FrmR family transcriptional regulator